MRTTFVRLGRAAAVCALLSGASLAHADPPSVTPPRLARFVEAADPRPAGPAERSSVELELDIDAAGAVSNARVVRSGDPDLDAAAITAASAFTFEPARRDDQAVPARIRYEYVFAARAPEAAPAPVPAPVPAAVAPEPTAHETAPVEEGATARVAAPPREVTKRALESTEITKIAGTRGDPLRAIELLPGVSRSTGDGPPILRGSNGYDTQVFMDGAPVPNLYHFGGLTSFVHGRVLESVDVYPSNFSARFGRKAGGVVEARLRDPRTDGFHGIAEVSLLDSSLLVETPIGEKFSMLGAIRRSNIDAVINSAQSSTDLGITAAPVYWDYQAIAAFRPTDVDRLRLVAYGSSDSFKVLFKHPDDDEPAVRGAFGGTSTFHRVQLGYRHRFRGGSEQNTELTYGHGNDQAVFGRLGRVDFANDMVQGRTEWASVVSAMLRVTAGLDLLGNHYDGSYRGIPVTAGEGDKASAASAQRQIAVEANQWVLLPGAYVEAGIRPVPALLIVPGVRADYNDFIAQAAVDPRLSARLDVTDTTTLKAGVGRFSQSPDERQVVAPIGNPALRMTHATHATVGVEQKLSDTFSGSLEGFGKWIDGAVAGTPGGVAPFFENSQEGRIFGGETMLRLSPRSRFFGFLSYTLMRSERRDAGQPWRLFDRDQTHILAATGVYRLGRGWEAGATLRYTSGSPYTPVTSSTYDASTDVYSPRSGKPLSERNPAFSRLDLRIQKTWTFSRWSLAAYLDVQNVLDEPNREGFSYSYDYRERQGARGLPILPILGLRGEL